MGASAQRPSTIGEVGDLLENLTKEVRGLRQRLDRNNKLRNLALATAFLCLLAAGFSGGYALRSREQLRDAETELTRQIDTNQVVVCSSARSAAVAFREPQISSHGIPEPEQHFIERMLAQREQLRAAGRLGCGKLPGFAIFPFLRARALHEIEVVLYASNPNRFHAPRAAHGPRSVIGRADQGPAASTGPPAASPQTASSAPSHHATAHPAPTHTEGGGHPPTGSHEPASTPVKGTPPVPEPSGPAQPSEGAAGTEATTTEPETSAPAAPGSTSSGLPATVEAVEGLVCRLSPLGVRVCTAP